jgi:hypothetical protein
MLHFLMNQLQGVYKIMGCIFAYSDIDNVEVVSN